MDDDFNRLASRTVTAGTQQDFTYSYDRWGNWLSQMTIQGGPSVTTTFDTATNRIQHTGLANFSYDAAGNVSSDGAYNYTYDAEGNMVGVAGVATYVYDALNHRVETVTASGTQQYLFHPGGQRAATLDAAGNAVSEPSYFAGGSVAYFRGGGFHYQHQDWLGTERVRTSSAGSLDGTFSSLPFGDGYTATGVDTDASHFTGLDRDSTGLSHAMFRDYSSVTGTWMRPDPYAGSYDQGNPQSFNRYAYVLNGPMTWTDPSGLDECDQSTYVSGVFDAGGHYHLVTVTRINCDGGGAGGLVSDPSSISVNLGGRGSPGPRSGRRMPQLPTCLAVGVKAVADAFGDTLGPLTDLPGAVKELAEAGLHAASGLALIRASNYALKATNTLGGKGLLVPLRSSSYRALLADSAELAEAASGAWIALLDYNLGKQIYNEIANPIPCQ